MQSPSRDDVVSAGFQLPDRAIPSPIALTDRFLVFIRWAVIIASGIMSNFDGFGGSTLALPTAVWLAVVAYNLPISFHVWRHQPLANGRGKWLLWADLTQAMLAVVLTGGYRSFYFTLFLLTITELALAYPWRDALSAALGISGLEIAALVLGGFPASEPFAAYLVVSKFILSVLVGGLVTVFGELLRREEAARITAARRTAQIDALNTILIQLSESSLNLEGTLAAILRGARLISDIAVSLVLIPDVPQNTWQVAACDSNRYCVGERISGLKVDKFTPPFFATFELNSFPPFKATDGLARMAGAALRAPDGEAVGILIVGWQNPRALRDDEREFLQALVQEAGMALRNARLYLQEQEHIARLKRFEQLQSTFFSAIGHELKTPLTILKTLVPSLSQWTDLTASTRAEIVETFSQNLKRLETMIADWLESARLEAGAVTLYRQPIDLVRLSQHMLDELSPLMARKHQKATLLADTDLPTIQGDYRRLEQVLSNLVGNAVKFAPLNSTIGVQLQRAGNSVQVCVEDAGPGVPLSEHKRIFEKFYTSVENQALAGAGLGLFVCRELVQLHGGRIWVQDRPGGGSRFCFTLPCRGEENSNVEGD